MSAGQLARQRSSSSGTRPANRSNTPVTVPNATHDVGLQPCAATASIFLFAQGNRVICLHHDSLAIERKFERHKEPVVLLSVDNVSERGSGRLVVSYDAGQTAIVWDLFTGDEIARFASYEPLKVAAWMKDGNVAFGMGIHVCWWSCMLILNREPARQCHPLRASHFRAQVGADDI